MTNQSISVGADIGLVDLGAGADIVRAGVAVDQDDLDGAGAVGFDFVVAVVAAAVVVDLR